MVDVSNCKITHYPMPVLRNRARPVEQITDDIRKLADKMIDIMIEKGGVGLAGPQAGVPLRIFVISLDGTRENAKVYINPEIQPSGPLEESEEGCLSIPEVRAKIRRHKFCSVTATDLAGNRFSEQGEGLLARALQHEYDHLEGTVIADRMGTVAKLANRRKLKQLEEKTAQD